MAQPTVVYVAQVASADAAVVFDLQSLSGSAALNACLQRVLGCGGGGPGISDGSGGGGGSRRARPSASRLPGMGMGRAAGLVPRSSGSGGGSEHAAGFSSTRMATVPAGSVAAVGSHTSC